MFVFYLGNRQKIWKTVIEIIFSLRQEKEYQELISKKINPEVYPFLIGDFEPLFVFLDATDHGIFLKSCPKLDKLINLIKNSGAKRIALPSGSWCWTLKNLSKEKEVTILRKMIEKRVNLLFSAAKESLAQAEFSFNRDSYNLVVRRAQEAIELLLSGVLASFGVHYPKDHDQAPMAIRVLKSNGFEFEKEIEEKIQKISIDLSRKRGPALHQEEGFDKKTAEQAIKDARWVKLEEI